MSTSLFEKSVELKAFPSRVWQILTEPELTTRWLSEFSPGTTLETDWKVGSEVIWRDGEGAVGAIGKITASDRESLLLIEFPEEQNPSDDPQGAWSSYSERYQLSPSKAGATLSVTAGPIPQGYFEMHAALWEKAIRKIVELATVGE